MSKNPFEFPDTPPVESPDQNGQNNLEPGKSVNLEQINEKLQKHHLEVSWVGLPGQEIMVSSVLYQKNSTPDQVAVSFIDLSQLHPDDVENEIVQHASPDAMGSESRDKGSRSFWANLFIKYEHDLLKADPNTIDNKEIPADAEPYLISPSRLPDLENELAAAEFNIRKIGDYALLAENSKGKYVFISGAEKGRPNKIE